MPETGRPPKSTAPVKRASFSLDGSVRISDRIDVDVIGNVVNGGIEDTDRGDVDLGTVGPDVVRDCTDGVKL